MQIVIDIPKEIVEWINEYFDIIKVLNGEKIGIIVDAIKNGTPLPKNHGDLIDVNRKITVSTYDEQYEEWGEKTLTILEALNKWSDEGVTVKDVIIPADTGSEE